MKRKPDNRSVVYRSTNFGLTLIELLIVIMILGIIMTMAIPRLRIISEDRSIREAVRIAGSQFSKAAQRAVTDGAAGVCIELNPNILDVDNVQYAGTALYLLRAVPPYNGDDLGVKAVRYIDPAQPDVTYVRIPVPYQYNVFKIDDPHNILQLNDTIRFNFSQVRYRIEMVRPDFPVDGVMQIQLFSDPMLPPLPGGDGAEHSFVVDRQPRIDETSRIELPEGYVIDLRFSGELKTSVTVPPTPRDTAPRLLNVSGSLPLRTVFHDPMFVLPIVRNRETKIYFDRDGSIDRYYGPTTGSVYFRPNTDLNFFISKYETKVEREQIRSANKTAPDPDPLDSPTNMWLTVNMRTGGATISYNAPPPINLTLPERILAARSIAATGSSAAD